MLQNRVISMIFLVLCAIFGYFSTQLPKSTMVGEPGPKFFPILVIVFIAILSVMLFFMKDKKAEPEEESEEPEEKAIVYPTGEAMMFYAAFIGGIVLTGILGFLPGMVVSLTAMLVMAGWKLFPDAVAFSAIMVFVVYAIFVWLLRMPLPNGIIF